MSNDIIIFITKYNNNWFFKLAYKKDNIYNTFNIDNELALKLIKEVIDMTNPNLDYDLTKFNIILNNIIDNKTQELINNQYILK